ncbi:SIR2 family protein, partial [Vibrio cholerae]|nr:SIR2 family protein [Vibrio cholerae]
DDFSSFSECVIKASEASDSYESASVIINMMLRQLQDPQRAISFLKNNESNLSEVAFYDLMSEIELYKEKYDKALELLERAYSLGLDYNNYILSRCFILIKSGKYAKVIDFVDEYKDTIDDEEFRSILIVNQEFSKKKLNKPTKDVVLRNLIGKKLGKGMNAACHSILGEIIAAQNAIDDSISKNRLNYGLYKTWVVLDETLLKKHNHTHSQSTMPSLNCVA